MDLQTLTSCYTQHTMIVSKHQDVILSQELSQLLITSHVLSYTMTEVQHTPSDVWVCVGGYGWVADSYGLCMTTLSAKNMPRVICGNNYGQGTFQHVHIVCTLSYPVTDQCFEAEI